MIASKHAALGCLLLHLLMAIVSCTSSEGTRFTFAFPPTDEQDAKMEVRIVAKSDAQVVIKDDAGTDVIGVLAGFMSVHTVHNVKKVTSGIEPKGMEITSSSPVSVQIGIQTHSHVSTSDQIFIRPFNAESTDFYIVSYIEGSSSMPFYMVVASQANTNVTIENPSGTVVQSVLLDEFDVYTFRDNVTDFTGYHVYANKPISVYTGNSDVNIGDARQYIAESMPSVAELGTNYVSFPIENGRPDTGYIIRILSTAAGTLVEIPELGIVRLLNRGQFSSIDYFFSSAVFEVQCSNPCYVFEIAKATHNAGGDLFGWMGAVLIPLTPTHQYSDDLLLTTPYADDKTMALLTITVDDYPVQGLYLDDENIDDIRWKSGDNNKHATATISVTTKAHTLHTTSSSQRFAAYVYSTYHDPVAQRCSKSFSIGHSGPYQSKGTRFLFSFPFSNITDTSPYIRVTSEENTNVVISTTSSSELFPITAGSSITYTASDNDRVIGGVETKAYEVTAGKDITVHIGTAANTNEHTPEDTLIRPVASLGQLTYVMSHGPRSGPGNFQPGSFYSVIATTAVTNVEIRPGYQQPVIHSFPLRLWEVFTDDGGKLSDFTGYLIQADQPVLVMSGHGDVVITDRPTEGSSKFDGYLCEVMPSTVQLGTDYTTFPVDIGLSTDGYRVRILVTEPTTVVTVEEHDVETVLNASDFIEVPHYDSLTSFEISCSKPCQVAQYIVASSDDILITTSGPAMTILTPDDQFSQDLYFASPWMDGDVIAILAIVANDSTNLYLNDRDLIDAYWTSSTDGSYSYTTVSLQQDTDYRLYYSGIVGTKAFAGYIYTTYHSTNTLIAKGTTAGYNNIVSKS